MMNKLVFFVLPLVVATLLTCKSEITALQPGCVTEEAPKHILGTWHYSGPFTANKRHQFWGTISFNRDSSITDPDSLLGFSYGSMPIIKQYYVVTSNQLKLYSVTKVDTLLMEGEMELNECNKLVYSGWPNSSIPDYNLKLTLTR